MEFVNAHDWIERCSARLQQQWRTVDPYLLADLANDLFADEALRRMAPELAAVEWLQRGVPLKPAGQSASDANAL